MKDKNTAGLLALLLGGLGVHRFYVGQWFMGLVYFFFCWTFIPALLGFIEAIMFFAMSQHTFNVRYNQDHMVLMGGAPVQMAQNVTVNVPSSAAPPTPTADVGERLDRLNKLRLSGALSDDEFQVEKVKLLTAG